MEINLLNQLYLDFLSILDQVVIKYKNDADKYETTEMKKESDIYIKASLKQDVFETYYRYEPSVIAIVLGIEDEDEIDKYVKDRSLIPYKYRNDILKKQRQYIIDNYEEKNNYYRKLIGLPNIEETEVDWIYPDFDDAVKYGIREGIPVHMLDQTEISILTSSNYIEDLIKKYPQKDYLKYLGSNKIDLITARRGKNFSLLRIPSGLRESMWNTFSLIYEQCREYFMSCIYINEYRSTINYYDNFIALCIMVMTMQQIIARVLKSTIERDFFDSYCVKILFELYGVPYYSNMSSDIQSQIVQNLNLLVLNKGTNKVLYDIASILGYDRLNVYKYYLIRSQKFDENGVPYTYYKTNEFGEEVLDYEKMFSVYFQKIDIDDIDVYKSLSDTSKKVSYREIVEDDPYWIEDAELMEELYQSEYNYVETKYMGVSISYKLTKILFENIYLLKMIFDKKDELQFVNIDLPKLSLYGEIPLFDAIVILCALTCKQNHLKGEILTSPSKILHVLGFDFNKDFELVREDILNNEYLDDDIVDYFSDMSACTVERLNYLYQNIINLYDILVERMSTATDINVYRAYKDLFQTLYYCDENESMFNIGTEDSPKYAKTFLEYVQYAQPAIYEFIQETDEDNLYIYTNHIITKVSSVINNLSSLGIFADSSNTTETMLVELINFFKSYTTDMIGLDIVYVFDFKPELLLKLIDDLAIHKTLLTKDDLDLSYTDSMNFTANVKYSSDMKLFQKITHIHALYNLFDVNKFIDDLRVHVNINIRSSLKPFDFIFNMHNLISILVSLTFKELIRIHGNMVINDKMYMSDMLMEIIKISVDSGLSLFDIVSLYSTIDAKDSSFSVEDSIPNILSFINMDDRLSYMDKVLIMIQHFTSDNLSYIDNYKLLVQLYLSSDCRIKDSLISSRIISRMQSILKFSDEIRTMSKRINFTSINNFMDIIASQNILIYLNQYDTIKLAETESIEDTISKKDVFSFSETYKIVFI